MSTYRIISCLGIVILIAVVPLALSRLSNPAKVNIDRRTAEQIRVGMTEQEVEDIVGGPADNYPDKDGWVMPYCAIARFDEGRAWTSCHGNLNVVFDDNGRVTSVFYAGKDGKLITRASELPRD